VTREVKSGIRKEELRIIQIAEITTGF